MNTVSRLLILELIEEADEVISAMVAFPSDKEALSCVVCNHTIGLFRAGSESKRIRVSHRSIEWQLSQSYVWISVPTDTHIQVFCPRCAEIELMVPRI